MADDGDDFDLAEAYAVETPDDNRELYRKWAATYETGFMAERGYVYHERVAALLLARNPGGPVLDVGCGTGVVGQALVGAGVDIVDGIDISPEMLGEARTKRHGSRAVYRGLIEADLTGTIDLATATYGAVISVGTFTHGHLGPQPINELLRVATPGADFALGINAEHYATHGFADHLAAALDRGAIVNLELADARIYTGSTDDPYDDPYDDHADDMATVALFSRGSA